MPRKRSSTVSANSARWVTAPYVAAIEAIYGAASEPSQWPSALQAIGCCFHDSGAVLLLSRGPEDFEVIVSSGLETATTNDGAVSAWGQILSAEQPSDVNALASQQPASFGGIDFHLIRVPLRAHHDTRSVYSPREMTAMVGLVRTDGRTAYSDDERALLRKLADNIQAALHIGVRLLDVRLSTTTLGESLARAGIGVFLLDGLGGVTFTNAVAQKLIGDVLRI